MGIVWSNFLYILCEGSTLAPRLVVEKAGVLIEMYFYARTNSLVDFIAGWRR